jgi:hypothetical protein
MEDLYGAPTSSNDERSLQIYQRALAGLNCYRGDPVANIDKAQDPNFAMGHVFRAHARGLKHASAPVRSRPAWHHRPSSKSL